MEEDGVSPAVLHQRTTSLGAVTPSGQQMAPHYWRNEAEQQLPNESVVVRWRHSWQERKVYLLQVLGRILLKIFALCFCFDVLLPPPHITVEFSYFTAIHSSDGFSFWLLWSKTQMFGRKNIHDDIEVLTGGLYSLCRITANNNNTSVSCVWLLVLFTVIPPKRYFPSKLLRWFHLYNNRIT